MHTITCVTNTSKVGAHSFLSLLIYFLANLTKTEVGDPVLKLTYVPTHACLFLLENISHGFTLILTPVVPYVQCYCRQRELLSGYHLTLLVHVVWL